METECRDDTKGFWGQLDKDSRDERQVVADWVLYYRIRKKEQEENLTEYANAVTGARSSAPEPVPIYTSTPGDPTGAQAVKIANLAERIKWYSVWLELVEDVRKRLPWKMRLILQLRWEKLERDLSTDTRQTRGRPQWIPYCQHGYCAAIAKRQKKRLEDCWVASPDVFSEKWSMIVSFAMIQAAKRGLI